MAVEPWITDDELKSALMAWMKVVTLPEYWDTIINRSNITAWKDIQGILLARGFLMSQIDSWDRREEFLRDLGMYWALTRGAGAHDYSDAMINKLDRREELRTLVLQIGQESRNPTRSEGTIESGDLDESRDRYTRKTTW
jgi:hypothetical protein